MTWLHQLPPTTQTLDFSKRTLNHWEDALNAIPLMGRFRKLVRLDLSNNDKLMFTQYEQIGQTFMHVSTFKELKIRKVKGTDFLHLLHVLGAGRRQFRVLDFSGTSFIPPDFARKDWGLAALQLGLFIKEQRQLEELRLPNWCFTPLEPPLGVCNLLWFFSTTTLTSLYLGDQVKMHDSVSERLPMAIARLTNLQHLALNGTIHPKELSDDLFERYKYALSRLSALTSLSLKGSQIGTEACVQLVTSLPNYTALTSLNLSGAVKKTFNPNELQPLFNSLTALTSLNFSRMDLSNIPEFVLYDTLRPLTALEKLKLNRTGVTRMIDVVQSALVKPNLLRLELIDNNFKEEALEYLVSRLPMMERLGDLRLINPKGWRILDPKISDAVKRITAQNKRYHMMRTASLLQLLLEDLKFFFKILSGADKMFGYIDYEIRFTKIT